MAASPGPAFPVTIEIPVAWGEMDAFGHVNNVAYFRYFESARIAYFERIGALATLEDDGCAPILAQARCRFRRPVVYPDRLSAAARVSEIGADRFTMLYAVTSAKAARVVAEGDSVVVWYDYRAGSKARLPARLRARIEALEGAAPG